MPSIFVCTAAWNEPDLLMTIESCFKNADNPEDVYMGISLQYDEVDLPNLKNYKNIRYVHLEKEISFGTSSSRSVAASLRQEEDYYLSIDSHTIFKPGWDTTLISKYLLIKQLHDKPIITTYGPYWYKNGKGEFLNQEGEPNLENKYHIQVFKFDQSKIGRTDQEITPHPKPFKTVSGPYEEHYIFSANFAFTSLSFLEEVPFDTLLTYQEEHTTAVRAWTRGYRMFAISEDVLWSRDLSKSNPEEGAWWVMRSTKDHSGYTFTNAVTRGSLRVKRILTGEILGTFGALNLESLSRYEEKAEVDYKHYYGSLYSQRALRMPGQTEIKDLYSLEYKLKKEGK